MTVDGWITVVVLLGVIAMLALTSYGQDLIMLAGLTVLLSAGVLNGHDALAGFANEGIATVGILFVVAAGLRETGAVHSLAQRVLGRPRTPRRAQLRLIFPVMVVSAFIYNTPLVAILLPVVHDWGKKLRVSLSHLMIPLSYATILGGLCTLIGTSSSIVINGLAMTQEHMPSVGMFQIAWIGLPCAAVGAAYILLCSRWLLKERQSPLREEHDPRQYTIEVLVEPRSPLAGRTIEEAGLRHLPGLYLLEVIRGDDVIPAVGPGERLRENDRLVFVGVIDSVVDLQKIRGLRPATDQVFKLNAPRTQRCLIEAVVSNTCPVVNRTIRESRFRTEYNAAVIAVARNGARLRQKIGDIILQPGDTLLLEALPSFITQQHNSRDFYLVSAVQGSTPVDHARAPLAVAILLAMLVVAVMGWVSMLTAAMLAAGLMIVTRCCTGVTARQSVNWQVLLVIAASFGLGRAMGKTGVATTLANALIGLGGNNPWLALSMVFGVTMIFTEVMSHNAAAVLVFPIAMATAHALHVSEMPFIMAMMVAASCSFATPIAYPTNVMVYGPGGYRFGDFVRFGAPLNLLLWAVTSVLTPLIWPF